MPNSEPADSAADALKIDRHQLLSTAIPFPRLRWCSPADSKQSLLELHDYAVALANSTIDWYLTKKRGKKRLAIILHRAMFIFGSLAALVPILKILDQDVESELVQHIFGWAFTIKNPSAFVGDLALVLIGLAGGVKLLDRSLGTTSSWMRYVTTATRLNRALTEFEFEWSELRRTMLISPVAAGPQAPPPAPPAGSALTPAAPPATETPQTEKPVDPIALHVQAAHAFCMSIIDITSEETAVWVDDLKERIEHLDRQLQRPGGSAHPSGS